MSHATLRALALGLVALLVAPLVLAAPTGPSYPPQGGVTLGSSGNIGRAGGLTWTYADIQMHLFNGIWWGPWAGDSFRFAFDGAIDEPTETLVFDFGSNMAGGEARWLGSTDLRHYSGGQWVTQNLPTRLTIRASLPDATPIPFLDPTTVGLDGDLGAVIAVPGDYRVNALLEAQRNNVWTPVWTLYDGLSTDPACTACVRTSVGAGFYTDLNLPPVANFTWEAPVVERRDVTFTSTSSDPEGRPLIQAWDLDNDGEFDDTDGDAATTSFATPGVYPIGLQVVDDRGLVAVSIQDVEVVDCAAGPVSDALRNTVYPTLSDVATGETVYAIACEVVAPAGL